jgi:hypothetical protein
MNPLPRRRRPRGAVIPRGANVMRAGAATDRSRELKHETLLYWLTFMGCRFDGGQMVIQFTLSPPVIRTGEQLHSELCFDLTL